MNHLGYVLLVAGLLLTTPGPGGAAEQNAPKKPSEPKTSYLIAGHLFDGTSDQLLDKTVVVISGERIESVGPAGSIQIPSGAEVIDLSDLTVLPGLIDCHTHLAGRADRYDELWDFKDTP